MASSSEVPLTPQPLAPLFEADRLALVGASERNHYAVHIFKNLQNMGFDPAKIIPIHPSRPEVFGLKAYPRLADVPGEIPLAVIAVNNKAVVAVVEEAGQKKIPAAVVFADGFAEGGEAGKKLQHELAAAVRATGIKLLGPNCMGFVAVRAKLGIWGGALPELRPGNIGLVFQSSGMMNLLINAGARRGLGFHVCASGGNEIALNSADYLAYQAECPEIEVIATYFEAAPKEPERFAAALDRAIANGKSVLVLRAGRTERARRNVIAHTGQLAGSVAAWDAFFEQHGAIIVHDLDDLIDTTALFAGAQVRPDKHERGVGLITISGGDCTLLSDIAEQEGVPLPDLGPETRKVLVESLDKPTLLGNPLDVEDLQRINPDAFERCLEKFFEDPAIDMLGVRLNLPETITHRAAGPGLVRQTWEPGADLCRRLSKSAPRDRSAAQERARPRPRPLRSGRTPRASPGAAVIGLRRFILRAHGEAAGELRNPVGAGGAGAFGGRCRRARREARIPVRAQGCLRRYPAQNRIWRPAAQSAKSPSGASRLRRAARRRETQQTRRDD